MENITFGEVASLCLYQGSEDLLGFLTNEQEKYISEIYGTLNILMYEGIASEQERIREKKLLFPKLLEKIDKILAVYMDIFELMEKKKKQREPEIVVYRTERGQALELLMRKKHTVALTSTSRKDNLGNYFRKKKLLTLLVLKIPEEIPYIDVNDVLKESASSFKNEEEILLPPYLPFSIRQIELSEKEKAYRDIEGHPPAGKYELCINKEIDFDKSKIDLETQKQQLFTESEIKSAENCLEKICRGEQISEEEERRYSEWKQCFQEIIKERVYCMLEK